MNSCPTLIIVIIEGQIISTKGCATSVLLDLVEHQYLHFELLVHEYLAIVTTFLGQIEKHLVDEAIAFTAQHPLQTSVQGFRR